MIFKRFVIAGLAVSAAAAALFVPRAAQGSPVSTAVAKNVAVSIVAQGGTCTSEFCYSPPNVTIRQANQITWTNNTTTIHTVTRCTTSACSGAGPGTGTDPAFNSGIINPGSMFVLQSHRVGTYNYYCQIHGYLVMHGTITVKPFIVQTASLPAGTVGQAYSSHLAVAGGQSPFHWTVKSGKLPAGLKLGTRGLISGTPTVSGTSQFTVQVTDSSSPPLTAAKVLSITVR
jgi:plastocyanin